MRYIGNAFSLGMLDDVDPGAELLRVLPLSLEEAQGEVRALTHTSCVGHADTAALLTALLGVPVVMARNSTSLRVGDEILVAQYNGPRLPEGATSLPEGAKIRFFLVGRLGGHEEVVHTVTTG